MVSTQVEALPLTGGMGWTGISVVVTLSIPVIVAVCCLHSAHTAGVITSNHEQPAQQMQPQADGEGSCRQHVWSHFNELTSVTSTLSRCACCLPFHAINATLAHSKWPDRKLLQYHAATVLGNAEKLKTADHSTLHCPVHLAGPIVSPVRQAG